MIHIKKLVSLVMVIFMSAEILSACDRKLVATSENYTPENSTNENTPAASKSIIDTLKIGNFYANLLNGVTYVFQGGSSFIFGIGTIAEGDTYKFGYDDIAKQGFKPGICASDYSIEKCEWVNSGVTIKMSWGKITNQTAGGIITVDSPIKIAIQTLPGWTDYVPSQYCVKDNKIIGRNTNVMGNSELFSVSANLTPEKTVTAQDQKSLTNIIAAGSNASDTFSPIAAMIYEVTPDKPLIFTSGVNNFDDINNIQSALDKAEKDYTAKRVTSSGDWGDFLGAIINNVNNTRIFQPNLTDLTLTSGRGWSLPDYARTFCWDSFFNAMLGSLEDPIIAKSSIRAMLACQYPSGMVPNYGTNGKVDYLASGDRSQPPVGAMAVWNINLRYPDKEFLAEVYPKLLKWHDWWVAENPKTGLPYRDGNKNGLLEWGSDTGKPQDIKWESGMDDNPLYDEMEIDPASHTMKIDDVGLTSLWAMDAKYLAIIARELGKTNDAEKLEKEVSNTVTLMNKLMWNEELGMYCNLYWEPRYETYKLDPVNIPASMLSHNGKPGLAATYYKDRELKNELLTRVDEELCLDQSIDTGDYNAGSSDFSACWEGQITPDSSGEYSISIDGSRTTSYRIKIDDKVVTDAWDHIYGFPEARSLPISLKAGKSYNIEVEAWWTPYTYRGISLVWYKVDSSMKMSRFSTRFSPTNFYPMIVKAPDDKQAEKMLKVLTDENRFWGEYVLPTISIDDPAFPDQNYWRGKIWAPTNYLTWLGLKNYSQADKIRNDFADKSISLFMKNWNEQGVCCENYMFNGTPASDPHLVWGALLNLIGLESICDISDKGEVMLNSNFKGNVNISRLPIGGKLYDLEYKNGKGTLLLDGKIVKSVN